MNTKRALLGHPLGLAYIAFTEAWERFAFYGMQALLVLYMAGYLFEPGVIDNVIGFSQFRSVVEGVFGELSTQALAAQIFGIYIGLVYLLPVFGGYVGDRVIGRKQAVLSGAVFMAIGHFLMAVESAFLFALLFLILGSGLLKGNLAAQVGMLYDKGDQRRDAGFTVYNVAINVGATVAPLVCGTLGEIYGWHYGFGAAGVGMLVGIVIYVLGLPYIPAHSAKRAQGGATAIQADDWKIIAAIAILILVATLFWTAQTQVWNSYPLWIKARVDRVILDFTMPVTWFQAIDAGAVLLFAPLIMWFWGRQRSVHREPVDIVKIAIGFGFFSSAFVLLALGEWFAGADQLEALWPVTFHLILAIGFLYVGPIMMSLISRAAPSHINGMMVSAYYLSIFLGGILSGWLGRFYEVLTPGNFWLLHAGITACGLATLLVIRRPLERVIQHSASP